MSSDVGRGLLGATRDVVQEFVREQIDDEVFRIQIMDINKGGSSSA